MEMLVSIADICSRIGSIIALVVLLIKPIRNKVLGMKKIEDGQKCMLRSDMLHVYYKNRESNKLRQYEMENFIMEYKAYKALDGNSFIDNIYKEVCTWEVVT